MKQKLPDTLLAPERPSNILSHAKWLAGEGAGSWFLIESNDNRDFCIARYSPTGILECRANFIADQPFDIDLLYEFDFPSHCQKITIVQNAIRINLKKNPINTK